MYFQSFSCQVPRAVAKVTPALITDTMWKNSFSPSKREAACPVMTEPSLLLPFPCFLPVSLMSFHSCFQNSPRVPLGCGDAI